MRILLGLMFAASLGACVDDGTTPGGGGGGHPQDPANPDDLLFDVTDISEVNLSDQPDQPSCAQGSADTGCN